ncbi:MAG TPA: hypothetical protein VEL51_07380 [Vicinamibacterales bacterium]|nr:hypothetical protein [Vicinamibacterales bacterium]
MRSFVTSAFVFAVALAPAASFAQTTTSGTATTTQQQPPAAAASAPAAPKVPFSTPAGILLVQIKPDKTADFEEMVGKLRAGFAKTQDETLKKQAAGFKVYKSTEPFGPNTLYVVQLEPTVPNSEYELFNMLLRTMTPEEQRAEGVQAMWKRYADAFAAGLSKLSLTPLGGM